MRLSLPVWFLVVFALGVVVGAGAIQYQHAEVQAEYASVLVPVPVAPESDPLAQSVPEGDWGGERDDI